MPETINTTSKEITKIMATVNELKGKFDNLKSTLADEAVELKAKFDELKALIKEKEGYINPADLDSVIADIDASVANMEALSDTANDPMPTPVEPSPEEPAPVEPEVPAEPSPEEPAPTEPTFPEEPVEPFPTEEPVDEEPVDGGDGSEEEPNF